MRSYTVRIRVRDDASGVAETRVEIDGSWYLSMYKRDVVSLELKEDRVSPGNQTITVYAGDRCGNEAYETKEFTF